MMRGLTPDKRTCGRHDELTLFANLSQILGPVSLPGSLGPKFAPRDAPL